jgi:hypothetical protein
LVLAEASAGDPQAARARLAACASLALLEVNAEVEQLSRKS